MGGLGFPTSLWPCFAQSIQSDLPTAVGRGRQRLERLRVTLQGGRAWLRITQLPCDLCPPWEIRPSLTRRAGSSGHWLPLGLARLAVRYFVPRS